MRLKGSAGRSTTPSVMVDGFCVFDGGIFFLTEAGIGGIDPVEMDFYGILWDVLGFVDVFARGFVGFVGILWDVLMFLKDSCGILGIWMGSFGIPWDLLTFLKDSLRYR